MTRDEQRWRGHSRFQQELSEYVGWAVIATGPARVDAVADLVEFCLFEGMKHENKHCGAEDGPTIDEQVIRHTEVPFDGDVSSQDDIKAFWDEREKQKAGTPEDSRSSY